MESFKKWLESESVKEMVDYGFSKFKQYEKPKDQRESPIPKMQVGYIIESLKKVKIGIKEAKKFDFYSSVHWGNGPGSINVSISPFGGVRASIRKESVDTKGKPILYCKSVINIPDYDDPEKVIQKIYEEVNKIDKEQLPSPIVEYLNLEKLSIDLASNLNRHMKNNILMFAGIRGIEPTKEYIIQYNVAGSGVQALGQKRVDQFQIYLVYEQELGTIKIVGNELGDSIAKHRWKFEPSDFIEYFSPAQSKEEIIKAILNHMNSIF